MLEAATYRIAEVYGYRVTVSLLLQLPSVWESLSRMSVAMDLETLMQVLLTSLRAIARDATEGPAEDPALPEEGSLPELPALGNEHRRRRCRNRLCRSRDLSTFHVQKSSGDEAMACFHVCNVCGSIQYE
jgi:DNA-directed RNA polymerase subunit M/transcription elongation factor TFIIS